MTATHLSDHGIDKNSIEQVFLDLDMSIVASDEHKYLEYAQQVRQEYIHYKDADFFVGRSGFLKGLVGKDIFKSEIFQGLNEKAWQNISMEIEILEGKIKDLQAVDL